MSGCIILALLAAMLTVIDAIMDESRRRRIIWVTRQTTRWRQMTAGMDFGCAMFELEHAE